MKILSFKVVTIFVTGMLSSFMCFPVPAQGTRDDYHRTHRLRKLTAGKVFKANISPHWFDNGTQFWYRNELPDKKCEFILVDALKGVRKNAFDHVRLAAALTKALGIPVHAEHLPVENLEFRDNALLFASHDKGWRCNLESYELSPEEHGGELSLPVLDAIHPSPNAETGTAISFLNKTADGVRIYWIDYEGERKQYAELPAGERWGCETYPGHVWEVTDSQGRSLAIFEATAEMGTAVIDRKPIVKSKVPPPPPPARGDSPDGRWQAFVKNQNVFVRVKQTGEEFQLSHDGRTGDGYGNKIFWSPDSAKLVAVRTRVGDDRKIHLIESSPKDQLQPKLRTVHYLKPGDRIAVDKPGLFDVANRRQIPVADTLFTNPWSISDIRWRPDSSHFSFLYNQRGHQVLRIISVDAMTGAAATVVDEQSKTFIDYAGKLFYEHLDDSHEIIWMSERDGWNHLYLYDAQTGRVKNQITHGNWVVRGVDRVDAQTRQIWFRAGGIIPGQDPYYIHYCRINFDGNGLVLLTEGDGTHTINVSPDRKFLVDSWSRVDLPPVTELRRSSDGHRVCELETADWNALLKTGWRAPEHFVAKGRDGVTDIYGVICRPTTFNVDRRYPILEDIYAGPQDSFVPKAFKPCDRMQEMAELGFIVVQIDGMGTSNRSKAFHDVCWKNIVDAGFPDRILWIKAASAKYPYMDLSRIGIYGGSAGGQNALGALLTHGEFYKAAVADCGCHDNRMDKIWWNELWMGWPVGPHYAEQSNVTLAPRLQGKLLLIVGELDDNVDPSSTLQVVNALIKADKDFEMLVIPGAGHCATATPYGNRRMQDFFVRSLLKVEPRRKP